MALFFYEGKQKNSIFQISSAGKANFFLKAANPKSANSWAHSSIANPQISWVCKSVNSKSANFKINQQIANLLFSTNYNTTLSLNSPNSRLFKTFFYFEQI
jgi:hypothetical protein